MLILTRRIGESLRIGDDVSLMVLGVQGNQVRIGADAPKEVAIHREEIYRRIQAEKAGLAPAHEKKPSSKQEDYDSYTPMPSPAPAAKHDSMMDEQLAEGGTRFYSTDGKVEPAKPKKAPTVIVKKKRNFENV